jgi:transposase
MVQLGELMMILELHRQGLSVTAIARRTGRDPKKYMERGIEAPRYGPRSVGRPGKLAPFIDFLRERVVAFPDLSAVRLTREIRELGYSGAYAAVKRFLAAIRPKNGPKPLRGTLRDPAGGSRLRSTSRASWGASPMIPTPVGSSGCSAWCSVTRASCSRATFSARISRRCCAVISRPFEAIGGVPIEILYDRMKTAVMGEEDRTTRAISPTTARCSR